MEEKGKSSTKDYFVDEGNKKRFYADIKPVLVIKKKQDLISDEEDDLENKEIIAAPELDIQPDQRKYNNCIDLSEFREENLENFEEEFKEENVENDILEEIPENESDLVEVAEDNSVSVENSTDDPTLAKASADNVHLRQEGSLFVKTSEDKSADSPPSLKASANKEKLLKKDEHPIESKVKKFNFNRVTKGAILLKNRLFLKRSLAIFIVISFLLMSTVRGFAFFQENLSNTKGKVIDDTNVAYQYLLSGQESIMENDFDMAFYKFNIAAERFQDAEKELNKTGDTIAYLLKNIPGGSTLYSGKNLLEAGANIAYASKCLAQAFEPFSNTEDIFAEIKNKQEKASEDKLSFTLALVKSYENLLLAQQNIGKAKENLKDVNPQDFPNDIRPKVLEVKYGLPKLEEGLEYFVNHVDVVLAILGHDQPRKYLLLFQNNRELRATGGFIGTYGLFDMKEGKIEDLKVEGPYNIDGQMIEKITAPEALRLIQSRFYMRDANWFLDYPTSAEKIALMHEKAGGPTVDGVFSFTATVFEDLLQVLGPIEMPEYGTTVTSENFFEEAQREVELDYDKDLNRPKKFISDLLPIMFDRFSSLEKEKWGEVLNIFWKNLYEKNILVYFTDEDLQELSSNFGWSGEIKDTKEDFLSIVTTNVGGGKTDHVINQEINYYSEIQTDGSVINTVKIKRKHNGDKEDFWTSIKNMSFLRVYVPQDSTLIEADGFDGQFYNIILPEEEGAKMDPLINEIEKNTIIHEPSMTRISEENGKTVFGNYTGLEVEEEKEIVLRYKLPFKISLDDYKLVEKHSLFIQKQPGSPLASKITGKINYPNSFKMVWKYPEDINLNNKFIQFETNLDNDKAFAFIFEKEE